MIPEAHDDKEISIGRKRTLEFQHRDRTRHGGDNSYGKDADRKVGGPRYLLPHPGHNGAQDVIDAGGIALSIFPEPVVNVAVEASGHQHFGSAAELRQLLFRQWPTSATPGSGREKTTDDRGDRFQLLGGRVRLHAEILERGRAGPVERIRWGEDDGARK